jgi:3-oxoacyl-[acyl-carrier-protein] synthase-1
MDVVYVAAPGASTAIGRTAWSSAAAVRAGVSGFTDHPYKLDSVGEPVRVALAAWLDVDCEGVDRFEALLVPAIVQALEPITAAGVERLRIGLALAIPSERPGLPARLDALLRTRIANRFPSLFAAIAVFMNGHAGGMLALRPACRKILDGEFDACVVAGVDSYLTLDTLQWLEENDQLHGAGALNNAWGFVPGEGAGAVLLCSRDLMMRLGRDPLASVLSVGISFEPNRIKTETVCIGAGLTDAFRKALASLPGGEDVTDVFCDLNGEPYRADEFGFAALRTKDSFVAASDFVAPADCWGDVAAASAPLALILASIAGVKSYARGRFALLWASSEGGDRGAALLDVGVREQD